MKQIDKTVKGIVEPKDINVLWLDTNDPKSPILKAYADGEWKAISSGEGGGGSAEGAVSYNEQTLTEAQQMQARANQGLYYKESVAAGEIAWDGDITELDYITIWGDEYYKVSEDISIVNTLPTFAYSSTSIDVSGWDDDDSSVQSGHLYHPYDDNSDAIPCYVLDNAVFIDDPNFSSTETQPITGVYVQQVGENVPLTISWDAYSITHKIPSEYIPTEDVAVVNMVYEYDSYIGGYTVDYNRDAPGGNVFSVAELMPYINANKPIIFRLYDAYGIQYFQATSPTMVEYLGSSLGEQTVHFSFTDLVSGELTNILVLLSDENGNYIYFYTLNTSSSGGGGGGE